MPVAELEPAVVEKPRMAWWKNPPVTREVVQRLRDILHLTEEDELPEAVCVLLGMRSAIDTMYSSGEIPHSTLVDIVLQSHLLPLLSGKPWITPGSTVTIKSQNREAVYVCAGPLGKDLVNRYGVWFLVDPEDIEADEAVIVDSTVNRHAKIGEKIIDKGYDPNRRHMKPESKV